MKRLTIFLIFFSSVIFGELVREQIYRDADHDRLFYVVRELGAGGYGKVYEVREVFSSRRFAIKTFKTSEAFQSGKRAQQAMQDVYASPEKQNFLIPESAKLSGPGLGEGLSVQVMDVMDGDLGELATRLNLTEVNIPGKEQARRVIYQLDIFRQMLGAYKALKDYRIAHRDINPRNFFYRFKPDGRAIEIKLGDADLAVKPMEMSGDYQAIGTLSYMAPENLKIRHYHELTSEADLYSIAGTMFYMLTGKTFQENAGFKSMDPMRFMMLAAEPGRWEKMREQAKETLEKIASHFDRVQIPDLELKSELRKELGRSMAFVLNGLKRDPKERTKAMTEKETIPPIVASSVRGLCSALRRLTWE